MKVLLRIVAVFVGLAIVMAASMLVVIARAGWLGLADSEPLVALLLGGVLLLVTGGSVAAIQLWRLRRMGLALVVTLCGFFTVYFVLSLVAVLLSPAAWRACANR
jgi:phosphatidylserine synthase